MNRGAVGLKIEEELPLAKTAVCKEARVGRDKVSNFVKSGDGAVLRIVSCKGIELEFLCMNAFDQAYK